MSVRWHLAVGCVCVAGLVACSNDSAPLPPPPPPAPPATAAPEPPAQTPGQKIGQAIDTATENAKDFFRTAQEKFTDLKDKSNQFIDEHKGQADADSQKAKDDLKAAVAHARQAIDDLNNAGESAWKENKPKVDAALADLKDKFAAAKAKLSSPPATAPSNPQP